jgi:hypothetical protein
MKVPVSTILLVTISIGTPCCQAAHTAPQPTAAPAGNVDSAKPVSDQTAQWMLKRARSELTGKNAASQAGQSTGPAESNELRRTTLFLSRYDRSHGSSETSQAVSSHMLVGAGESLSRALDAALAGPPQANRVSEPDRIKIDILDADPVPIDAGKITPEQSASQLIDVGVEGIELETGGRTLYLLPSDLIYESIAVGDPESQSAADLLGRAMSALDLPQGRWTSPGVTLKRIHTISFVEDGTRTRALKLLRGFIPDVDSGRESLLRSAGAGGNYLIRMQRPDGRYYYTYDPLDDKVDAVKYNIVRHAGVIISLFDLYAATKEIRYLNSARRGVAFLKRRFQHTKLGLCAIDFDGKAKLGANGLALLALTRQIEIERISADLKAAEQLAGAILHMLRPDGSFETYSDPSADEQIETVSLYYPGEAMLGLVRLYSLNHDRRFLDAAKRAADYLIDFELKSAELPPDAWFAQALEALRNLAPGDGKAGKYAEHAMRLADAMAREQYGPDAPAGYQGGFRPGLPRSAQAAARAEGMLAGYRIARSTKDPRAPGILSALAASGRFQLSQQFGPDNCFFLPDPARAAGGFHGSPAAMRIRIDYVQHNISSLLGIADVAQ